MSAPHANEPTDTRDRILAAAGQVFSRRGFMAATLDQVAAAAGLTKGAIYWHFRSKNDLFFALLDHKFTQHTAPVPDELRQAALSGDARQAATTLLRTTFARLRADPDWPRLYLEFIGQARDPEMQARLARFHADSLRTVEQHIGTLRASGMSPSSLDIPTMAIFWASLFDGLMLAWIINPQQIDHDALAGRIVDMLWRGLAPDADTSQPFAPNQGSHTP